MMIMQVDVQALNIIEAAGILNSKEFETAHNCTSTSTKPCTSIFGA